MSRERESALKRRARPNKSCVSPAREASARKWLKKSAAGVAADETQQKLHAAAKRCIGELSGSHPSDAKSVRKVVRQRLKSRYGR